ncbi:MAG TPA: hypothetical protein IAC47_07060 [Candidatus Onthomorpha intestinigallinarum]|uniref:Uncharacterized protein n=1 Tax=Candidatus Onthomorpha intestinigallinarum TaxID=2840880 RepID=A0A9D1RGT1_9BACT|nr:hypothetical protein [Candidatus Onthomorpha intestinigallinarum]
MKKYFFILYVLCYYPVCSVNAQIQYTPIEDEDVKYVQDIIFRDNFKTYLNNKYISCAIVDFGPYDSFLSFNPIEGIRIKFSGRTNENLSKRMRLQWMAAYGTNDRKFKYGMEFSYNLNSSVSGEYYIPKRIISLKYIDNTSMPNMYEYDKIQYSISPWRNYYLSYAQEAKIEYKHEILKGFVFIPFFSYNRLNSVKYYESDTPIETLKVKQDYFDMGLSLDFCPSRQNAMSISKIDTRLNELPTRICINYKYRKLSADNSHHHLASFILQERIFFFNSIALDLQTIGGKIFGSTIEQLYFTPAQSYGLISNIYGLNLSDFQNYFYRKEYLQTFLQINLCGLLTDKIKFLRQFRMNEFVYIKSLYGQYKPYHEIGVGLDNIFYVMGIEIIRSIKTEKPSDNGFWGIRLRVKF